MTSCKTPQVELMVVVKESFVFGHRSVFALCAQVNKGYGYPVALAEAHNQAVVRGADRSSFFALLEQELIKTGIKNVGTSYKETRKRGSIA